MTEKGTIEFEDGSKYEGELVGGVPNGHGVLTEFAAALWPSSQIGLLVSSAISGQ